MVAINMEYLLAPEATYPSGADDVAAAHQWILSYAQEFGGDCHKVFLMGHSAGGSHVGALAIDPSCRRDTQAAGVILVSARLRADVLPGNPNAAGVRANYDEDTALHERRAVVTNAQGSDIPFFIAIAEFEKRKPDGSIDGVSIDAIGRKIFDVVARESCSIVACFNPNA
jgi:acetyl esterase/lipase